MAQGILTNGRVRLMMAKGATHYRPRRVGERKRRSVRGCIVGSDLSVLNLGAFIPQSSCRNFYGDPFDDFQLMHVNVSKSTLPRFISHTLSSSAVVVKKGAAELPGITDDAKPRRLGPKRATAIRKLFNLKNVGASSVLLPDLPLLDVIDMRCESAIHACTFNLF